ncbi:hypothetical protein SAMN04488115_108188 [Bosea lathyri]|uniref:Uncharacterized protein n=2 Tax=Bosea lathyri TaxID=1036778 RepID=A0A1H6BZK3_9HYPH|nr:hypothetical protein SAMN04488115_108188 [Bosea lathyri]
MPDQMVKQDKGRGRPPVPAQIDELSNDEKALVALFRAVSAEDRLNILRYAEATHDIQAIFRTGGDKRNH